MPRSPRSRGALAALAVLVLLAGALLLRSAALAHEGEDHGGGAATPAASADGTVTVPQDAQFALGIRTEPSADARTVHTQLGFDVADSNADATGDIPFPTVLVIDHDGVVVFADVHTDYTTRTEVDEIVAALDLLEARAA